MEIRVLKEGMLEDVLNLLNASMVRDNFTMDLLKEKIFGDADFNEDLNLVAVDNDNIIGFISGVKRNNSVGYIKFLAVEEKYRRKKIGTGLLEKFTEIINKEENLKEIRLFESAPNYYMPGLDPFYTEAVAFFERQGFEKFGDTSNLVTELDKVDFSLLGEYDIQPLNEFNCRRAFPEDIDKMLEWTAMHFNGWEGEIEAAFKNEPLSLFICELKGEIVAFSAYDTNNKGLGWFGPMGTLEVTRGKGIGGKLYLMTLRDMLKMGYKKAIIPWVGPIPFYMHYSNAKVDRVFWRYKKVLF